MSRWPLENEQQLKSARKKEPAGARERERRAREIDRTGPAAEEIEAREEKQAGFYAVENGRGVQQRRRWLVV